VGLCINKSCLLLDHAICILLAGKDRGGDRDVRGVMVGAMGGDRD